MMIKSTKLLFTLVALTFNFSSYSQSSNEFALKPTISGEGQVTPGGGDFTYTIPLFTLSSEGVDLPINLVYRAEGFQPNHFASRLGMGWSLLVGGEVTRIMNGAPDDADEAELVGYLNSEQIVIDAVAGHPEIDGPPQTNILSQFIEPPAWQGKLDFQPDYFSWNSLGNQGLIAIKRENTKLPRYSSSIPNTTLDLMNASSDIDVSVNRGKIIGFRIASPSGIDFHFNRAEATTFSELFSVEDKSFNLKYYITKIKNSRGALAYQYRYHANDDYPIVKTSQSAFKKRDAFFDLDIMDENKQFTTELSTVKHYLDTLSYEFGMLVFNESENYRADLPGHRALESIEHFDNNGRLLEKYVFEHSYLGTLSSNKQLLLQSISYQVVDGVDSDEISMTYFSDDNAYLLPRETYNIDFWGFYSPQNNSGTNNLEGLLPNPSTSEGFGSSDLMNSFRDTPPYCSREPLLSSTKMGMMESISYSSGKTLTVDYELNDYSYTETSEGEIDPYISDTTILQSAFGLGIYESNLGEFDASNKWVEVLYNANDCDCATASIRHPDSTIVWTLTDGVKEYIYLDWLSPYDDDYSIHIDSACAVTYPPQPEYIPEVSIISSQYNAQSSFYNAKKAGGLRVKKLVEATGNGEKYMTEYMYLKHEDSQLSSGVLLEIPNQVYFSGKLNWNNNISQIYTQSSGSNISGSLKGNGVVYLNMRSNKCQIDNDGNCILGSESDEEIGQTHQYFKLRPLKSAVRQFPFLPEVEGFSEQLLLDSSVVLDANSDTIQTVNYEYERVVIDEPATKLIPCQRYLPYQWWAPDGNIEVQATKSFEYVLRPEFNRLIKVTTTDHLNSQKRKKVVENSYGRTDQFYGLTSEVATELEDGTETIEITKYVGDYELPDPLPSGADNQSEAIAVFQSLGLLGIPIEKYTVSNGKVVSASIDYFEKVSGINVPIPVRSEKIFTKVPPELSDYNETSVNTSALFLRAQIQGTLWKTVEEITVYDNEYKYALELQAMNDLESAVLVDSFGREVATVLNGEYASTRYTSFEDEYYGGWDIQGADLAHVVEATGESDYAVTGNYYYNLGNIGGNNGNFNSTTSNPLEPGKYLLTYWSKNNVNSSYGNGGLEVSHQTFDEGPWEYHEKIIEWTSAGTNFITMSGDGFIDELRLTQVDGTISTKGYYPDGKTMYESDPSGEVATYEYDSKGRLEWVLDRERNVIEYHQYEEKDLLDESSFNKHEKFTTTEEGLSKDDVRFAGINDHKVKREITYSDGFGRFRQKINFNVDQSNRDKIVFAEYDKLGRSLKNHLPYYAHVPTDDYIPSAPSAQLNFYSSQNDDQENTDAPYAVKELENNPFQRSVVQGGVGTDLQPGSGHSTQLAYGWNTMSDPGILKWDYNHDLKSCMATGDYPVSHLTKIEQTDPDGRKSIVWKDLQGREVAVTSFVQTWTDMNGDLYTKWGSTSDPGTEMALTSYTVYDDFGRVVYEIPAIAMERMEGGTIFSLAPYTSNAVFNELITYYEYDEKGRLIVKHAPAQGYKYIVYDIKDRPVMSQNSQQGDDRIWSFKKYDSRGRIILQGETIVSEVSDNRFTLQGYADAASVCEEGRVASGGIFKYSNLAFPTTISEADVFRAYYFDDYGFTKPSNFDFVPFEDHPTATEITRGLTTGSKTRVFKSDGTLGSMLTTVSYYDNKGRNIQAFTENHKGGFDRVDTYYNLRGQVEKTDQFHKYESSSDEHQLTMRFTYTDQTGHLKNTWCKIDDDPEILLSNRYFDAKGQLKTLKLHRPGSVSNYLQRINYRYNAQGQLTHINNADLTVDAHNPDDDDVFGQEMTYFKPNTKYDPSSPGHIELQYGGNISSMMWKTKTPEEDGAMQSKNIYLYRYDGLGQMSHAFYQADDPALPGLFDQFSGDYNEHYTYFLGGNVRSILRNNNAWTRDGIHMDDLTFTYYDDSYRIKSVQDNALTNHTSLFKHFVDGSQTATEYQYDSNARLTADDNRQITMDYNPIGLPRQVEHTPSNYGIGYMYDAAGNKLQKYHDIPPCPPNIQCAETDPYAIDYIGNFVYNDGELEMIYHPEGVIRPTPASAENETEYVFDYFIKDYLGNVRAVITSEDALYTDKFLATMEDVHAVIEEENFDNLNETREDLPTAYPVDGSVYLNERIASLSAENGTEMGPSLVMPVKKGDKVSLSTTYFYEEDAPGTTYQNMDFFLNEILLALASSGSGVLNLGETQLINMASGGDQTLNNSIMSLLSTEFDTTDVDKPHAYLVWMFYDQNMNLDVANSGAAKVENPNSLETLLRNDLDVGADGYLHAYVSNGSEAKVNFDNFLVQYQRGKLRQINDYYPYGLTIAGINSNSDEYLNKYTTKELQTGEFDPSLSTGLEMFDFGSRFYDPQLGVWFAPDPAEQFHNPYLGIGNNPVMYVDPNGEIAFMAVVGIFAGVQLGADMIRNDFKMNIGEIGMSVGLGAIQGALAFSGAGGLGAYAGTGAGWLTLGSAVAGQINIPIYEGDNFSLSISPSLATGTNGVRLGANAFASYRNGDFSISGGYSLGRNFSSWDLSEQMAEAKWSSISSISAGINGTDGGFNLGLTKFGGNYPSTVGRVGFSKGRFAISHENDFLAPNNQDAYRTGRLNASWQVNDDVTLNAGFEVFTGKPNGTLIPSNAKSGFDHGEDMALRNGIASIGVQYRGNDYRVGWNSERLRSGQNAWHDFMGSKVGRNIVFGITGFDDYSHHFTRMPYPAAPYTYFGRINPFTGYGF